jgi:hypothetical protein
MPPKGLHNLPPLDGITYHEQSVRRQDLAHCEACFGGLGVARLLR